MKTTAKYQGKIQVRLNLDLINKKGLSQEVVDEILKQHINKLKVFTRMNKTDDPKKLKKYAIRVKSTEFALQRLWGFAQDSRYHRWFDVPKCKCAKMDNADRIGTDHQIYDCSCPIHGGF